MEKRLTRSSDALPWWTPFARLAGRVAASGSILCFHGIAGEGEEEGDLGNVPFCEFIRIVRLLEEIGVIVPLEELLAREASNRSTAGLFAITFDDAYRSLLDEVIPWSAREEVPITIFACSRSQQGRAFWWDRVHDICSKASPMEWERFENEIGVPPEYLEGQPGAWGRIRPVRQWILRRYRGRTTPQLDDILADLEETVGPVRSQRSMSPGEMEAVAAVATVRMGIHTRTHPVLPLLDDAEIRDEVKGCFDDLRDQLTTVQPWLALPYGFHDARVVRAVLRCGIDVALSVNGRTASPTMYRGLHHRIVVTRGYRLRSVGLRATGIRQHLIRGDADPALPSAVS